MPESLKRFDSLANNPKFAELFDILGFHDPEQRRAFVALMAYLVPSLWEGTRSDRVLEKLLDALEGDTSAQEQMAYLLGVRVP